MSHVRRRCVVWIGDYEPTDVAQRFSDFQRGLKLFAKTWSVTIRSSSFALQDDDKAVALWVTETKGPNWRVETEFRLYNWSDLLTDYQTLRWDFPWRAVKAFANFVRTGTLFRYFKASWKFGLLFCYPLLIGIVGLLLGFELRAQIGKLGLPLPAIVAFLISAALIFAYWRLVDPVVPQRMIRFWIFLHDLAFFRVKGLSARLDIFAHDLVEQLRLQHVDEVLVVGHGIGAALQPIILDRAFWQFREFGRDGQSVNVLSVGSLLLAVGLHEDADWLTGPVLRLSRDRMVFWAEYQASDDVLSFPGINPANELAESHGKPSVRSIRIRDLLSTSAWPIPPKLLYHVHWQFVRANTKRHVYDFFMICCGPFSLRRRVKSDQGALAAFEPDGRLKSDEVIRSMASTASR